MKRKQTVEQKRRRGGRPAFPLQAPAPTRNPRPHDGAVQYSDEGSEEAHIDIVGDEDVDNGDVDDDQDQDQDNDEDEVKEIKTPSRPSSPSPPLTAQSTPPSVRARRYTSPTSSSRSNLGRSLPCTPHDETECELSESYAGTGSGSSSAAPGRPLYKALNTFAEKKNAWQKV